MNNRKQMIEEKKEIAKELDKVYPNANFTNGWIAEVLYKLGYRKIPEGAVVLTREEFSEKIENTWLNCQEFTRKETAEKFAEMAKAKKKYITSKSYNTCEVVFIKDIDEICKEFTEGKNET
ncbi:MAG: hypothetical protein IJ308_04335 [Clostridia bacterium]|nr:hypothetical protein [Clostridia bacterium]